MNHKPNAKEEVKCTAERNLAHNIVDALKEAVIIVHKDEVISANSEFYRLFKLSKNRESSICLGNLEPFEGLREQLHKLSLNEKITNLEYDFKIEETFTTTLIVNTCFIELGAFEETILISFNPKGQKEEGLGVKDTFKNFYKILSQAPAMICILRGPKHIFHMANENYFKVVGNRDIIGKTVREALPEIANQGFVEILDKVYDSGEPFIGNELSVDLDVGEKELKNSLLDFVYQPILNDCGEVSGIFVHAVDVTEKVKARRKLEQSEKELKRVMDTVPAIIWVSHPGGENAYLNKRWFQYTGQSAEESGGFGWLNSIHPDDRKRVSDLVKKASCQQEEYTTGYRLRNHMGQYRWVLDSGSPQYNLEGAYEGMIGSLIDVDEEKRKEQLLREKEHRIRSIIEEATVATAIYTGEEMKIEIANEAMIELWGKDDSIVGTPLRDALPELEGQPFHDLLKMVYTTGDTYWGKEDAVNLMINDKLQTGYFNFTYKPLENEKGEIYGILNMAVDVTETVKSRELLKESETRFRQLADLMPEKVANTDAAGNFTYFNQGWLDYTGQSSTDLINDGWSKRIHPNEKDEFMTNWQNSLKTGKDFEMEFRYLNKKNKYKWHLSRAEAVTDENKAVKMWICTATEIQKIKAEEKRKEDFLKMVSHELKTPLTSMKGYVQLMIGLLKSDGQVNMDAIPFQTYLERVDHQMNRLTRLISEMLDLSRLEKNKLELKKEVFPINQLIVQTVQDLGYTNSGHNIKITDNCECNVYGDKDRIGQVLINLITNAIKYSPGSMDIEVTINRRKHQEVEVSVKDFGIGISRENQKKIFKRFYRVDGNNEETYSGFGIGLFLAKEIIRRHHGSLDVESEMGQGSVFSFRLEIAEG